MLAAFYDELLGMRAFEPYGWLKLAKSPPDSKLQFALDGDGWSDQRPPRWPDPEYPQQMHLDILVPDVDAAGEPAARMGARLLRDQGDFRTYADPAGILSACTRTPRWVSPRWVGWSWTASARARWPDPAFPAQLHVDYRFPDGAGPAIERAVRLGAIHMAPNESTSQVYADPAGHPFRL